MKKRKNKKLIYYKKPVPINIGIVLFAVVMLYFVVYLVQYVTAKHISIYEVQKGQIMETTVYTGLILREETVAYSPSSGSINYYSKEGDKAGYGDLICSVDTDGSVAAQITAAGLDATSLSKDELLSLRSVITDYTKSYSDTSFYEVYSFQESLNESVRENLYLSALESVSASSSSFSLINASVDGVLAFYIDEYEDVTIDTFEASMYDPSAYEKINLKTNTDVSYLDAIYKTVTDENWYMMVPIDADEKAMFETEYASQIEGGGTFIINVTFKKDDASAYATATILTYGSEYFLQLAFNSSMVRYISERYMEIELGSDAQSGLKIPNSAITQKEFLLVPSDYLTKGGNSSSNGVIRITDAEGEAESGFVSTDIYATIDGYCYIPADNLSLGDVIQLPDSAESYTISLTGTLDGVYNMNKGYAVFKRIITITANEEYTIVETGTSYGLSLYDRIALDSSTLSEGDYAN